MIIKELYELYGRLRDAGEDIPQKGRQIQKISFRIILSEEGEFVRFESTLGDDKKIPEHVVLGDESRTSGMKPFFLCDTAEYLLGYIHTDDIDKNDPEVDKKKKEAAEKKSKAKKKFELSQNMHLEMEPLRNSCPEYFAVCRFLEHWNPYEEESKDETELEFREELKRANEEGCFKNMGVFQIEGEHNYVHELKPIQDWWDRDGKELWQENNKKTKKKKEESEKKEERMCLVSGEKRPIAVLHQPAIKNVIGAQSSGAMLVSFNKESFCSYGENKESQGLNAPVSEDVAFGYCNALNWLTRSDDNRIRLGGDTIVFWSDAPREESAESEQVALMGLDFNEKSVQEAQDGSLVSKLKQSIQELSQGRKPSNAFATPPDTRFFILGISPNAARLSIRFWQESTFGDFVEKLRMHYEALSLIGDLDKAENIITPFRLLRSSVRDSKDIEAHTAGALMRAILYGVPYPDTLAMAIIRRFGVGDSVNHVRCAYLRAWLSRKKNSPIQIQNMLNKEETHPAYLLGRLFAALEKTQQDALPNLNRTIREAYYASASSTPAMVFSRLLRLYNHHLAKLKKWIAVVRDRLVQEIMDLLGVEFPKRLDLTGQGIFALGYYHQKQDFYTKKDSEVENSEEE